MHRFCSPTLIRPAPLGAFPEGECFGAIFMLDWFAANLGTILISLVLAVIVTLIVVYLLRQKKAGKSSCGANCAHCAMHGQCHEHQK